MINQNLGSHGKCLLRIDGTVGPDFHGQFIILGVLTDTGRFNSVGYPFNRCVDGVCKDCTDALGTALVLLLVDVAADITAAVLGPQFHFQAGSLFQMGNFEILVEDFDLRRADNVTGCNCAWSLGRDLQAVYFIIFNLHDQLLELQDDHGDIFPDTRDRCEFVINTINLDREYSGSRQGGQQDSAQCIPDRCAKSSLQRGQDKLSVVFRFNVFFYFKIGAFKLLHATILLLFF